MHCSIHSPLRLHVLAGQPGVTRIFCMKKGLLTPDTIEILLLWAPDDELHNRLSERQRFSAKKFLHIYFKIIFLRT
jgi:hypothetical protein